MQRVLNWNASETGRTRNSELPYEKRGRVREHPGEQRQGALSCELECGDEAPLSARVQFDEVKPLAEDAQSPITVTRH